MGKILSSRRDGEKIVFEVEVDYREATELQGHYDNIHLVTENTAEYETNIATRGKNDATKYFLIPRKIRKNINFHNPVNCQKIESKDKVLFVYVVDKNKTDEKIMKIDKT